MATIRHVRLTDKDGSSQILDVAGGEETVPFNKVSYFHTSCLSGCMMTISGINGYGLITFQLRFSDNPPSTSYDVVTSDDIKTHLGIRVTQGSGHWAYDDGDDHSDRYDYGTLAHIEDKTNYALRLGRFYNPANSDLGDWAPASLSPGSQKRYISGTMNIIYQIV